jgi:hypothetical protein
MDNQSTSPQIIFPNVPQDFCPTGDWSEVLQQFIDIVLANGTINVPGLGDVNPQQISEINNQLSSQQLQISAIDTRVDTLESNPKITVRTGVISVGVGNSSLNVTFSSLPSTSYGISIVPIGTSTSRATMGSYVLQAGQTTTGFTILVADNPSTVTNLRWTAIHTS